MKRYRLTLERHNGRWGQYVFDAENMESALRHVALLINLTNAKTLTFVEIEE